MRGIRQGEYEQGIIYSIVLLLISAIISAPHSPVYNRSRHQLFRQWIVRRVYGLYSPKEQRKLSKVKSKVILIWHHPQALVKTNCDFCPQNSLTPGCLIQSNITHSLHVLHGNITKTSRKQTILNQHFISTPRYNTHPPLTVTFHQKYLTCFETSSNTNQYFLTSWKLVCSWRRGGQVAKNKSIYFLWELNSIFHVNSSRNNFYCIDPQHGRLITWLGKMTPFEQFETNLPLGLSIVNFAGSFTFFELNLRW